LRQAKLALSGETLKYYFYYLLLANTRRGVSFDLGFFKCVYFDYYWSLTSIKSSC
jgi:hypothetical protein